MNEQQLQQAFLQFLAQKTGAQNQQELEAAIQQMGEQGLQQAYQEFMQMMQQQQVQAAKFGAKLNYIKSLRGQCPEGYEVQYYAKGGHLCKKCAKRQEMENTYKNPIDEFKCGRKIKKTKKKAEGGDIDYDKCGTKLKEAMNKISKDQKGKKFPLIEKGKDGKNRTVYYKDEATRDSIAANRYNDEEVQSMKPGSYKKNKYGKVQWTPDRTKYPYKRK